MTGRYDHGPETPWKLKYRGSTTYRVTEPSSNRPSDALGAVVDVEHPETIYDYEDTKRPHDSVRRDLVSADAGEGPGGQGALFGVHHAHPYVSWMHASGQFGAHIPTLLATAAVETRQRFGEDLRSDSSLSDHSSPIVHRLAQAGAVQAPQNESNNGSIRNPSHLTRTRGPDSIDVPEETVNMGRQFLRAALRRPKQNVQRSQSTPGMKQGKLFGGDK